MKKLVQLLLFAFAISLFPVLCKAQCGPFMAFDSLAKGIHGGGSYVLALTMKDSSSVSALYAGGHFKMAGKTAANNIAEWVDTVYSNPPIIGKWVPLGSGVDNDVCALTPFHGYLYAGGKFDTAGGIAASHIARWDTVAHTWDSLLGSLNGNVYALCIYHNQLYVGGDFTIADGDTVNRIAVWKDSVWAAVGVGFDTGAVYALTIDNDTLYAGGSFLKSNGIQLNRVAELIGNYWDSVGAGTNNTVYALASDNSNLYAGGAFTRAGHVAARYIAVNYNNKFTGRPWIDVGGGTNDTVRALDFGNQCLVSSPEPKTHHVNSGGNSLLVGGNFDSAFGAPNQYLTSLYGGTAGGWVNGPVYAITNPTAFFGQGGDNYIGGKFSYGLNTFYYPDDTVNNVAYLLFCTPCGSIPTISDDAVVNVYPNPSSGKYEFQIMNDDLQKVKLEVYNVLGEKVYSNGYQPLTNSHQQITIDLGSQPNGIYIYTVKSYNGAVIGAGKLVIQK